MIPVNNNIIVPIYNSSNTSQSLIELIKANASFDEIKPAISSLSANEKNEKGMTPLFIAARANRTDIVKALLEAGADPNTKAGNHPVMRIAITSGNKEIVELLINHGADIEAPDDGGSPLIIAAIHGKTDIMELLLDKGAQIDAKNTSRGLTAWHFAAYTNLETAKLLIQRGANIEESDNIGYKALGFAAASGKTDIVNFLLDNGAQIEAKNDNRLGATALHFAVKRGHLETVKSLIQRGANIEALDNSSRRPLFLACEQGQAEIVQFLLENGAQVDAENILNGSSTALATTIMTPDLKMKSEIITLLLKHGANVHRPLREGIRDSILKCAIINYNFNNDEIAKVFIQHIRSELEEKFANLQSQDFANVDLQVEFLSQLNSIYKIFSQTQYKDRFLSAIGKMVFCIICEGCLQKGYLTLLNKLEASYEKNQGNIEQITLLHEEVIKVTRTINLELFASFKQFKSLFVTENFQAIVPDQPRFDQCIKKADSLNQKCLAVINSQTAKNKKTNEAETEFDNADIFVLLTVLGGGIGNKEMNMNAKESYNNYFGCDAKDFWQCGLYCGKDLRAIGVDFSIMHLCDHETQSDPKVFFGHLLGAVNRKKTLLEYLKNLQHFPNKDEIENAYKQLDQISSEITSRLKNNDLSLSSSFLQEMRNTEITIGKTLLQTYFSQQSETIQKALVNYGQEVSLSQLEINSQFKVEDFYSLGSKASKKRKKS